MYAKRERKKVIKTRINLSPKGRDLLCERFNIQYVTACKYLDDVFNTGITAPKRCDIIEYAVNVLKGELVKHESWQDVIVIDMHDEPENHIND